MPPLKCEICLATENVWEDRTMFGGFRGYLCLPCNETVNLMKSTPDTLSRLVAYMNKDTEAKGVGVFCPCGTFVTLLGYCECGEVLNA